jgi:Cdc6-like AAA superfamily ATPase
MKEGILLNAEALLCSYIPDRILFRENELAQLRYNLQNYVNTFVTGPFGSGKTTLVKKALLSLNNSKRCYSCYIDCAVYQTTYSILKEIVPRSEFIFYRSNYELIKKIVDRILSKLTIAKASLKSV